MLPAIIVLTCYALVFVAAVTTFGWTIGLGIGAAVYILTPYPPQ